ncbi:hypothetical protein EZV73_25555 [Acidaminobacter sp. JC074]|uniref:hypothetical protein n=1 Tax=Acidaminobacter sp. JC074 TaxID=2530199 RepID=UPI001F1123AA|nr:hypothetical protein [Acidaminobacter sp. JC074]MCH4890970.1 hypothetical protein [Acidaminobacter sp. JC074]
MKKFVLVLLIMTVLVSCNPTRPKLGIKAFYSSSDREIVIEIQNKGEESVKYHPDEIYTCSVSGKDSSFEYTWQSGEEEDFELLVGDVYKVKLQESLPSGLYEMSVITETKNNFKVKHLSTIEVKQ